MASPNSPQTSLPSRSATANSGETEDIIGDEDTTETTKLFNERLQAWRSAVGYLEDYVKATEKVESGLAKDFEKVLKSVNSPLKLGHHFHQQNGGVAEMFDNIRSNTQGIGNSHNETSKALKGSVLPIFDRLSTEVKNKTKELDKGAGKASKVVEKSRNNTQKYVELLGQHSASFDSRGGNVKANEDPYLLQRQVYHRLHRQVVEENNNRDDIIAVQNEFARFESGVLEQIQQGMAQFNNVMSKQSDDQRNMYGDMVATSQRIPSDFEWNGFLHRNSNVLIDPSAPKRSLENISFANQDHHATKPLIAGSLERKGKLLKKYDAGYYVVTPSKYLHEFKSDDDFAKDPSPENSLYLPDCLIGAVDGNKFNVKGKDASKGTIGNKISMSHEFSFKAHTAEDAKKWHDIIFNVAGGTSSAPSSAPSSPAVGRSDTMSTQSPKSDHSIATGTTAVDSTRHEPDLADKSVNPVSPVNPGSHLEKDAVGPSSAGPSAAGPTDTVPTGTVPTGSVPTGTGPTGGMTDNTKAQDYAPL